MTACATAFDTFVVLGKNSFDRVGYLALKLGDLLVALDQRRADLLVVGRAYLLGRFLPLLLAVGLRVALLPLLLFALRLRAILLTVHGDRLPYQAGKEKACSRFHVGSRLFVRHKRMEQRLAKRAVLACFHSGSYKLAGVTFANMLDDGTARALNS